MPFHICSILRFWYPQKAWTQFPTDTQILRDNCNDESHKQRLTAALQANCAALPHQRKQHITFQAPGLKILYTFFHVEKCIVECRMSRWPQKGLFPTCKMWAFRRFLHKINKFKPSPRQKKKARHPKVTQITSLTPQRHTIYQKDSDIISIIKRANFF